MSVNAQQGININSNERLFLAGKTGSGKTTLAMYMLLPVERLIVVDSKDGFKNEWNLEDVNKELKRNLRDNEACRIRVVNDLEVYELLEVAYEVGNVIIYIDETTALVPPGSKPEQVLVNIWQRGRSRGIGAWATSQRPVSVPLIFLSEAEHFFCFRLNLEEDRKRMSSFMGQQVMTPVVDKYGFWYYNVLENRTVYYKRMRV